MRTDELRLERGAFHLHALGPRALAEFLAETTRHRDDAPGLLDRLDGWRRALAPEMLRATGGDRFPPHLSPLPTGSDE